MNCQMHLQKMNQHNISTINKFSYWKCDISLERHIYICVQIIAQETVHRALSLERHLCIIYIQDRFGPHRTKESNKTHQQNTKRIPRDYRNCLEVEAERRKREKEANLSVVFESKRTRFRNDPAWTRHTVGFHDPHPFMRLPLRSKNKEPNTSPASRIVSEFFDENNKERKRQTRARPERTLTLPQPKGF